MAVVIGTAVAGYAMQASHVTHFAEVYFQVTIVLGCVVALVAGIGVSLQDLTPQLNTFWRSRPINPSLWFVAKFVTGLIVVMTAIYVPVFVIDRLRDIGADLELFLFAPALHSAVYTAAVAVTCLVRHAVYAAVLSIGLLVAIASAAALGGRIVELSGLASGSSLTDEVAILILIVSAFAACIIGGTIVGWLAMLNDWGWKARY
jgi:hypothetical protein